jgi:hypothetical protein
MGLDDVSVILWRERFCLERLVFKLDAQRLLLGGDRDRWLPHTADEIETVLEELCEVQLVRAMEIDATAPTLGLGPGPSLDELADASPEPYDHLLRQHRRALVDIAAEIRVRSQENAEALEFLRLTTGLLGVEVVEDDPDDPDGTELADRGVRLQVRAISYEAALAAATRALQPSLDELLR